MPQNTVRQRVGIFGGSFDPIHVGHLLLAEHCREYLGLSQVRFVPAQVSPLKAEITPTPAKLRVEMTRLAISGHPSFVVDERETRRQGVSYTVDTLVELSQELPECELVFLMGADSLNDFDRWRAPEQIVKLARIAVVARGGGAAPKMSILQRYLDEASLGMNADDAIIPAPQIEISSSEIRRRVAENRSIRYQVHPSTLAFIKANQLYVE
ncbi:MAG TPA: nicotinate (nicotinamide) nucleotide adenylyltransferase [Planctomycetaceae bacterium]|nr:nicotinate (nicotinamide) nucleotide adenylyltransferase [Planctomycetaceae bacterium]